jgi:hypothetical protein
MMGWFYMREFYEYHAFLNFGDTTGTRSIVVGTSGGGQTYKIDTGDEIAQVLGSTLNFDTWYHATVTCAGTGANQIIGYLNGVSDVVGTGHASVTAETFSIGYDPIYAGVIDGRAAAVKFWGAVLTANEILNEMRYFAPVRWANISGWYPMVNVVVADNLIDMSGTANLTAGGTLTVEDGPPILWAPQTSKWSFRATAAAPAAGWGYLLGGGRNQLVQSA